MNNIDSMQNAEFLIRPERPGDYAETEALVREAFWNRYHPGCTEHYILHCFRSRREFIPELDLVLVKGGKIIGQIMYVHSAVCRDDGTRIPTMTFGPFSIHPDFQRQGYGQAFLNYSIAEASRLGAGALVITGNIGFYGKSGFIPGKTMGIRYRQDPDADYLLIREIRKNYLRNIRGTFSDPEGYLAAEQNPEDFDVYDRKFPKREKRRLPGQLPNKSLS